MASSFKTYPPLPTASHPGDTGAGGTPVPESPPVESGAQAPASFGDPYRDGPGGGDMPPSPPPPTPPNRLAFVRHPAVKLLGLGLLWLLMMIPNMMVESTVGERAERRNEALTSVQATWGGAQRVAGPFIVVPFDIRETKTDAQGKATQEVHRHAALWLPATLDVAARQTVEVRHKGLFDIPVYSARADGTAMFKRVDIDAALRAAGAAPADVRWENATLLSGVTGLKSVAGGTRLEFQGAALKPVAGGGGGDAAYFAGRLGSASAGGDNGAPASLLPDGLFGAPVGAWLGAADACASGCKAFLGLNVQGAESLSFLPLGSQTRVRLASDWPHPAFEGGWLPTHDIGDAGFRADWVVDELARGYPAAWTTRASPLSMSSLQGNAAFGARLVDPVDTYAAVTRSVKYAGLSVAMVFGTLWLFEMLAGARLHPVQYALTACALVLFGLVVLALAEHLGFSLAFLAGAATMTTMITLYARSALGAWPRALALGAVVSALYGGLWLMLKSEDNALLGGTGALVGALAVVMWLTRRVDWYRGASLGHPRDPSPGPATPPAPGPGMVAVAA